VLLEKDKALREYSEKVNQINERLSKLQALTNEVPT
jgi:CHASE3 domain sensor protein